MTDDLLYERIIAAPPEVVFDAFTSDGGQLAFYGQNDRGWIVRSESEVRVGGVWTIHFGPSPEQLYRHRHVFIAIDRPRRPERVRSTRATHLRTRRAPEMSPGLPSGREAPAVEAVEDEVEPPRKFDGVVVSGLGELGCDLGEIRVVA